MKWITTENPRKPGKYLTKVIVRLIVEEPAYQVETFKASKAGVWEGVTFTPAPGFWTTDSHIAVRSRAWWSTPVTEI